MTRPHYDLADYLGMLRRGWWLLLVCTLLGLVGAVGVTAVQTKVYEASTSVLVLPTGVPSAELAGGRTKATINLDTEAQLVRAGSTAALAKQLLKSPESPADLRKAVSVTVPANTAVLDITYAAGTPGAARAGSHAFAAAYLRTREEGTRAELDRQVKALTAQLAGVQKQLQAVIAKQEATAGTQTDDGYLSAQQQNLSAQLNALTTRLNEVKTTPVSAGRIISEAQSPSAPSRPVPLLNLTAGLMVGLMLGVGAVLTRQYADRRVHRGTDVARRAGVPLLAELTNRQAAGSATVGEAVYGAFTPAGRLFSRLRNEVAASLSPPAVVVVTGACRGPAAPALAANLAVAFSRAGNRVALVYADAVPAPGFGVGAGPGLSEALAGRASLGDALVAASRHPGLRVLPTGSTASAAGLLQSEAARRLLVASREEAEYVIVHAPPTTESADAQSLAIHADAVMLAVDLRRTTDEEVADAAEQLHRVGTPLLGAVALPAVAPPKARRIVTPPVVDTPTVVLPKIVDDPDDDEADLSPDPDRETDPELDAEPELDNEPDSEDDAEVVADREPVAAGRSRKSRGRRR
ncbi:MAG: Wzz/FepE/Etk N-terminal domain-containing protein [Micromonosporaceae bacterium]